MEDVNAKIEKRSLQTSVGSHNKEWTICNRFYEKKCNNKKSTAKNYLFNIRRTN